MARPVPQEHLRYLAYDQDEASGSNKSGQPLRPGYSDFRPRPAFHAWKRLIALFGDPVSFTPGSLFYSLTGNLSGIGHRLFQHSGRKFLLVVWQESGPETMKCDLGCDGIMIYHLTEFL